MRILRLFRRLCAWFVVSPRDVSQRWQVEQQRSEWANGQDGPNWTWPVKKT